jgi:hypothetical protein
MTYDKIIAKMDDFNVGLSNGFGDVKTLVQFVNALRAVVELHTPEHSIRGYRCTFDDDAYPCPTIQAIEKELS